MTRAEHPARTPAIEDAALGEIRRHAAEAYPDECCGALLSRDGRIVEAFRLPNTTASGARRRFEISPPDYRLAERLLTDVIGLDSPGPSVGPTDGGAAGMVVPDPGAIVLATATTPASAATTAAAAIPRR